MIKLAPVLLGLLLITLQQATGQTLDSNYLDGEIYVKYQDDFPVDFSRELVEPQSLPGLDDPRVQYFGIIRARFSFNKTTSIKLQKTVRLKFTEIKKADELVEFFSSLPFVEYAEKIPAVYPAYTPNDLGANSINNQWHLYAIKAQQAWDFTKGDTNIKVAVVDQEFDILHPDLINNVWKNPGEIAGNGIDDDINGYIDDINGWDAADNDNNVICNTNSYLNHGTPCAGLVGSNTDNGYGLASVGFNIKFLPVKVCGNGQSHRFFDYAYEGISYAAVLKADIISCSFGSSATSSTAQNVINYAVSQNCIVIASAGNDNNSYGHYPAGYTGVIAVAASDINDSKASFSNYGSWVDISAPGVKCNTTFQNSSYLSFSGTSGACPLAAGLLGLMKSYYPQISNSDLTSCLINYADNLDSLNPSYAGELGGGRINAEKAIKCIDSVKQAPPKIFANTSHTYGCPGKEIHLSCHALNKNLDSVVWFVPGAAQLKTNGLKATVLYNADSIYDVIAVGYNKFGKDSVYLKNFITINSNIYSAFYSDDFETAASQVKYKIENPDGDITWQIATAPTTANQNNKAFKLNSYLYAGYGQRDALISPAIDFTLVEKARLNFNFAFGKKSWHSVSDSLIVYGSVDSGQTFPYTLLKLTGSSLITASVIYNEFVPSSDATWCSGSFSSCIGANLDALNGEKNVVLKFEYFNDNGNNLYIDNISISASCDGLITKKPFALFTANDTVLCVNDTARFINLSTTAPRSYQWHFPGGTPDTSTQENPKINYNTPGIYDVMLIASNPLGSDTLTLKNYIRCVAPPKVTVSDTQKYVCPGDSVVFTASGADSIQWYKHNFKQTVYGERMADRPVQNTLYSVKAISPEGCYDSTAVMAIYVPLPPQVIIVSYPDSLMGHHNGSGFNYQWYLNDTLLPGKTAKYYRPDKSGNYSVRIIDSAGCTSISANVYFTYTPKPSVSAGETIIPGLVIYPNPSQGIINIEGNLRDAKITIYNPLGQVAISTRLEGNPTSVDVSELPNGIYYIKISNPKGEVTKKIIVNRQ